MHVSPLAVADACLIKFSPRQDERGSLTRIFCREELATLGFKPIAQINRSMTREPGTVRGLHYQTPPYSEAKLISCLKGRVFDVIADLRAGSPTFLQIHCLELSADAALMLYVPRGFAHGFQVLEPDSELLYMHDNVYMPAHEGGVNTLDQRLAIPWPKSISQLSDRDRNLPNLQQGFTGLAL